MSKSLHLANNLALPLDLATQAIAVLGIRGSGKTNTAGVFVEQCLAAGVPVAIVDPTDAWWGLRSSADGKSDGWPVLIFGGTHGDLPLAESDGKTIAEFIAKEQVPCILSVRHLRKAAQRRFVADVFEDLYHLKGRPEYRTPLCVVIDEAPLFVPQQVQGDVARTVGAIEDLVNRGRVSGFGVLMVSQRAATINKNVLTQADTIIAHRLTSPQDRKALREWIEENATVDELADVLQSLATLSTGEAWVWAPALDVMQRTAIRKRETFDSSRTPKVGERVQAPRRLAEINLDDYRDRLGKAIEEARENDPKELKRKLAELTKQLQTQKPSPPVVERVEVKVPVLENGQLEAAHGLVDRMREMGQQLLDKAETLTKTIGAAVRQPAMASTANRQPSPTVQQSPRSSPSRPRAASPGPTGDLTGTEQAILDTVLMLEARGIPAGRDSVARWLAIHPNGGRYGSNLARLRADGYLDGFTLTDRGRQAARETPTGFDAALAALPDEGKRRILRTVAESGRPLSRDELAALLGIHPNGGRFGSDLAWLRTMGVIPERGAIVATEGLTR